MGRVLEARRVEQQDQVPLRVEGADWTEVAIACIASRRFESTCEHAARGLMYTTRPQVHMQFSAVRRPVWFKAFREYETTMCRFALRQQSLTRARKSSTVALRQSSTHAPLQRARHAACKKNAYGRVAGLSTPENHQQVSASGGST